MRIWGLALAAVFLLCSAALPAEEIQLKDGSKLSGKVVAVTNDSYQIKTSYGDVEIPRTQIVSISFPENQPADRAERAGKIADAGPAPIAVDESLDGTTYTNRTAKFRLTVPDGWMTSETLRNQNRDIIAALVSRDQSLYLFVTPESFGGTLDRYRVLAETQFQLKFKDYETLNNSEARLDGRPSARVIWHAKNPAADDAPVKSVLYMVPYDGRVVRLMFVTLEPLFDGALPTFEKIAASYRSITP